VPCFDRNQDVRSCPHADSPQPASSVGITSVITATRKRRIR
jgi:hypothetical protein